MSQTGEKCCACKKGNLRPTGRKLWVRINGETTAFEESSEYECDDLNCAALHVGISMPLLQDKLRQVEYEQDY
jgi:hypothetical protein